MDECCSSAARCLPAVPSCFAVGGRTWSCELCGRLSCYRYSAYGRDGRGWCRTMAGGAAEGRAARCCGAFFSCGSLACVAPIVGSWCVARQCAKIRLVTYQLKGLTNRTYVPRMISGKGNEAARRSQAVNCSVRRWIAVGLDGLRSPHGCLVGRVRGSTTSPSLDRTAHMCSERGCL